MSLVVGIVGLPNVGKSSLFNALTNSAVLVENRPFATIEPNVGIVKLLDPRVDAIAEVVKPEKITHSLVKFLDIAGLVKGASQGEGLGNKFLEHIRSVDAICLVVRAFNDDSIFSVNENIDPVFEAEIVLYELICSDLELVENVLRKLKSNDLKIPILNSVRNYLQNNKLLINYPFTDEEKQNLKIYSFLTNKPFLILANTDDSVDSQKYLKQIKKYSDTLGASFISMNIKLENEISSLTTEEQKEFLKAFGREKTCLNELVDLAFKKLNLSSFFTAGIKEVRSWTYRNGFTASQCAGLIHTDIQRGFIKAKVIKYKDFLESKDFKLLKQSGKCMIEGKNYIVEDGDIIHFEFNIFKI